MDEIPGIHPEDEVPKLMIPAIKFSTLNLRDETAEKTFVDAMAENTKDWPEAKRRQFTQALIDAIDKVEEG